MNNSLITLMITVILRSCFLLIDWLSFGYSEREREREREKGGGGGGGGGEIESGGEGGGQRGCRLNLNVEGQGCERILDLLVFLSEFWRRGK